MENFFPNMNSGHGMSTKGLLDFTPLSDVQRRHMTKVFSCLSVGVMSCIFGVYLTQLRIVVPHFIGILAILGLTFYVFSNNDKASLQTRGLAFCGIAMLSGNSIGSLLFVLQYIAPSLVPTALFTTLALFISLSLAAMFTKQRSLIYLGGILAPVMTSLMFISLFNIYLRSRWVDDSMLLVSLVVYLGYILYDTQVILERARMGDEDYVKGALMYFTDLFSIFLKILAILMKKEDRKKKERD